MGRARQAASRITPLIRGPGGRSVRAPRTANGVHAELHRVARLSRRGQETASRAPRRARPRVRSAKLVIDRGHAGTRHAPPILCLKLGRGRHDQRDRSAFGRVVPPAVPALALTAEKIPFLVDVVMEGVADLLAQTMTAGSVTMAACPGVAVTVPAASRAACLWATPARPARPLPGVTGGRIRLLVTRNPPWPSGRDVVDARVRHRAAMTAHRGRESRRRADGDRHRHDPSNPICDRSPHVALAGHHQ